jgi:hypothetical protein
MVFVTNVLPVAGMRKTHFQQLLAYIDWAEERGVYYGQKKHFDARHQDLKEWVEDVLDMLETTDTKIVSR